MADWVHDGVGADSLKRGAATDGAAGTVSGALRAALDGWRLVLLGGVAGLALAMLVLRLVAPEHTAAMVVGPTSAAGLAAMGARVPGLGHDAASSAAEHGKGDEALSDFARFLHLLTSVPVAERLLAQPESARRLYPERWDAEAGRWRAPDGPLPLLKRTLLNLAGREDWVEPDPQIVARTLRERVVLEPVGTGPMRRILFRHPDRAFALDLLRRLAAETDAHLRAEATRRSAAQIAHIRGRLSGVLVGEHRKALTDLLADQERVLMMIEVDLPFAADSIEPPSAARLPDWPNAVAVLVAALAAGLSAGLAAAGARAMRRGRRGGAG